MARLRPPEGLGDPVPLDGASFSLGRDENCGMPLADGLASRKHAEIHRDERGWRILDLGSTNGTFVNGLAVDETALHSGDRIRIGHTTLRFEDEAEEAEGAGSTPRRPRRRILGWALLAAGLLLAAGTGLWALRSPAIRAEVPLPPLTPDPLLATPSLTQAPERPPAPGTEAVPFAPAAPAAPEQAQGPTLDLFVNVTGTFDHALATPDQNWQKEQDLELELVGLPLRSAGAGVWRGLRQTAESHDDVECVLEGGRLVKVRWRAARRILRTLADGRRTTAREESWELVAADLESVPSEDGRALSFVWKPGGSGPVPGLSHLVRLFPQQKVAQLAGAAWSPEAKEGADPTPKVRLAYHP